MKRILWFLLFTGIAWLGKAQKHVVIFKDKPGFENFNPYKYFHPKAIERRIKLHLPIKHISDAPVCKTYINQIQQLSDSITVVSRWLNGVIAYTGKIEEIKNLPFVKEVFSLEQEAQILHFKNYNTISANTLETIRQQQIELLEGEVFKKHNLNGKGVRIAVFDVGFPNVDTHPAFEHLRKNHKIVATYDFVRNKENPYVSNWHGTAVLSCIAGKQGDKNIGLATQSEFLLARTEMLLQEKIAEEENWLAAAEWADKNGADIINSSLGYTYHRYFKKDMNGEKSLISFAARMATRKGILVVNAAGNDGLSNWLLIGTPADVDSVLSVGAVDPETEIRINFSSLGPNTKGIMKPNVCASGIVMAAKKNTYFKTQGTSFASPLIAGFAACVWQKYPQLTNMQIFDSIQHAGQLFPYYDYAHGFGIPKASRFFQKFPQTFNFDLTADDYYVNIQFSKPLPQEFPYVFYKIQDQEGHIKDYYVVRLKEQKIIQIPKSYLNPGEMLVVWANGKIKVLNIP